MELRQKMKNASPEERVQLKREFMERDREKFAQNIRGKMPNARMERPHKLDRTAAMGFEDHEGMLAFREKMRNATPEERKQMRRERRGGMMGEMDSFPKLSSKMMAMGMSKEEAKAFHEQMRNAAPGDRKEFMMAAMEKYNNHD